MLPTGRRIFTTTTTMPLVYRASQMPLPYEYVVPSFRHSVGEIEYVLQILAEPQLGTTEPLVLCERVLDVRRQRLFVLSLSLSLSRVLRRLDTANAMAQIRMVPLLSAVNPPYSLEYASLSY